MIYNWSGSFYSSNKLNLLNFNSIKNDKISKIKCNFNSWPTINYNRCLLKQPKSHHLNQLTSLKCHIKSSRPVTIFAHLWNLVSSHWQMLRTHRRHLMISSHIRNCRTTRWTLRHHIRIKSSVNTKASEGKVQTLCPSRDTPSPPRWWT